MSAVLEFEGVVKKYGRTTALAGLDLVVPRGSIFGLVGSNGAGKTTALAVSVGLLRLAAGSVRVLGQSKFNPARDSGRVSLLPQDSRLPLYSRVEGLLRHYARLQGLRGAALAENVDRALEWVHLNDRRKKSVRTLSHGMRRRLMIAQAFLGDPELILLDEPLNGLDPREATRIRDLLRERREGQTVVISSHNLVDIETLCDRAAFIEDGKLVRQDKMDALTRHRFVITYVLSPGSSAPLDELKRAAPEATWETGGEGTLLTAQFKGGEGHAEAVNAQVIPVLLKAGVGICEIRRGAGLETEYLAATADRASP